MIKGIVIRQIAPADLKAVFYLGSEAGAMSFFCLEWTPENISGVLVSSIQYSLAAVRRNSLLGFIIPEVEERGGIICGDIVWLCAVEKFRDEIETLLVRELLSRNEKVSRWHAALKKNNLFEYNILQKLGFSDNGAFISLRLDRN